MNFRAVVYNEKTGECPWFVYVEGASNGRTFAARFSTLADANRVANTMNKAWEREGRLFTDLVRE